MPWVSLGVLSPTEAWQDYPNEVHGSETIRLIQTWGTVRPYGAILLGQYFPDTQGLALIRRLTPSLDSRILTLPIPNDFQAQGIVSYTLRLRLAGSNWAWIQGWQLEVQAFY